MALKAYTSAVDMSTTVSYHPELLNLESEILSRISRLVAEKWVAENYQKVVAFISPEAVATLTAAEAAAKIRETLEKKIPDKVLEVVRKETEVWQRGVFGGMTRLK